MVIFGAGRFLCGALLRPSSEHRLLEGSLEARNAYLEQVWPYVDAHVNKTVPRHSRLLRPLVLVEDPSKPFQLSDKGTIKKKATLDLYHDQIEHAYKVVEEGEATSLPETQSVTTTLADVPSIIAFVRGLVTESIGREIGDDDDFFNFGLDSLLAVKLRFSIISTFKDAEVATSIPRNVIYVYPNTNALSHYIWSIVNKAHMGEGSEKWSSAYSDEEAVSRAIDGAVAKLTTSFASRSHRASQEQTHDEGEVYVVTGTTGSLGSGFLSVLLEQPISVIRKVYLLNRTNSKATTMQRHKDSFLERGFDFSALEAAIETKRAVVVDIDVTQGRLGISDDLYSEVSDISDIYLDAEG